MLIIIKFVSNNYFLKKIMKFWLSQCWVMNWRPSCTLDVLVNILIPMAKYLIKKRLKREHLLAHSLRDPRYCLRNSGQQVTQLHSGRGEGGGRGRRMLVIKLSVSTFRGILPYGEQAQEHPKGGAPKSLNLAKLTVKITMGDHAHSWRARSPNLFSQISFKLKCQGWPLNSFCSPCWPGIFNPPVSTPKALGFQAYDTRRFLQ